MIEQIPYHRPYPLSDSERSNITEKINEVLQSGMLTNGEYCRKLEDRIAKMYDVDTCITTSNCTQALLLSLCMKFDGIFQVPAFNWWSDQYILDFNQRKVKWIDIDKNTWLSLKSEENGKYHQLYLHTFGNVGYSFDGDATNTIYDASHCLGAKFKDIGMTTCISLAPTKLVTSCEGGLILTNLINRFTSKLKELRDKCCRMSEVHAIIGLETLKHLDEVKQWKRSTYNYYSTKIPGQFQKIEYDSSYNTIGFLNIEGLTIPEHITIKQYYEPIHRGLPNTEYVYDHMVALPSYYNAPTEAIVESILDANDRNITRGE